MTREEKAQYCMNNPRKSPAFQFYPDHWFGSRHVSAMSPIMRGIHATFIFAAWLEPFCGFPVGDEFLTARVQETEQELCVKVLEWCWFEYKTNWFNERLLDERIKQIELSIKRVECGKMGGRTPTGKIKSNTYKDKPNGYQLDSKAKAKETKSVDVELNNIIIKDPLWVNNTEDGFKEYLNISRLEWDNLKKDVEWITKLREYHPGYSIILSINQSWENFWGTKAGWENKRDAYLKAKRVAKKYPDVFSYTIDWKLTIQRTIKRNLVRIPFGVPNPDDGEIKQKKKYPDISLIKSRLVSVLGDNYNYPETQDYESWELLYDTHI